ncbi:Putative protein of unknown function [Podospora comata]|uniref:Uncharacterized protein n=1 Tax=Podospora comata TaxID=48703 RepID=A0ABY6RZD4_PODCO|nr:Putative protein of unknown function [Podospora comata]
MGRRGRDTYPWDRYECDWCMMRLNWDGRPCYVRQFHHPRSRSHLKEYWESVRAENAAKRNKTLPRACRRAMMAAAAAATAIENEDSNEGDKPDQSTPVEEADATTTQTKTATEELDAPALPAGSEVTSKPRHHQDEVKKPSQKRQPKAITGPKSIIDEGVTLAFDDDDDVARIHAANRKAWPRGPMPIAADATVEDWEVAELVRQGLIGPEDLQVNYRGFGDEACLYTIQVVDTMKKGRRGKGRQRQGVHVKDLAALDAESEWSHLDDEVYAQFLSDEESSLADWSELSFVCVDS